MKVLSIKQPWASLIVHGIKDIENRTWKTKYRGRILIHASAATVFDAFMPDGTIINNWLEDNCYDWHYNNIPHSAIVGEVDIIDCVINYPSFWAERSNSYTIYNPKGLPAFYGRKENNPIYNWVLANPVLYDTPILNVKGKLSFWEFDKK